MKFADQIYISLRKVPKGSITTYKDLAASVGSKAYRAVGTAMNKNPYAPEVPCHRVVNSDGSIGGFAHGTEKKTEMLRSEGVEIIDNKIHNFSKIKHIFRYKK